MFKVFGKPSCTYCIKTKKLLERKGLEYDYVDILQNKEAFDFIVNWCGFSTVPQIYDETEHLGGYEALVEYLENKQ